MSRPSITDIIKAGVGIGSLFTGGATKSVLDIVNNTIADENDPNNEAALKHLADNDDQIIIVEKNHEQRLRAIEKKLGIGT